MKTKKSLAVLGAAGSLGKDLVEYLKKQFDIIPITRDNYAHEKRKKFDIFINANGNSRRFWALQNVYGDFELSTISVYKTLFDFNFKKYIYISSSDVYADHENPKNTLEKNAIDITNLNSYGFHKFLSEQIIENALDDNIILRSSMILSRHLTKGPFFDITRGKSLFITPDSKLQLITTLAISEIISELIASEVKGDIFNIGGQGAVNFANIDKYFKVNIKWSKEAARQHYEMDVSKLRKKYKLKTSEDYLKDWLNEQEI